MIKQVKPRIVDREALSRAGSKKTLAKLQGLAIVQRKRRDSIERARAALKVPAGFSSVADFLELIAELSGKAIGGRRDLAEFMDVDTSRLGKWFKKGTNRCPNQKQLESMAKWHRGLLGEDSKPVPKDKPTTSGSSVTMRTKRAFSWLPEELDERLVRTARRRNVTPRQLAIQIFDRRLPRIEELL